MGAPASYKQTPCTTFKNQLPLGCGAVQRNKAPGHAHWVCKRHSHSYACIGDEIFATLAFDTKNLKRIIKNLDYKRSVSGGDNNAARMYLLNIQKLFSSDVIKAFKDNADGPETRN